MAFLMARFHWRHLQRKQDRKRGAAFGNIQKFLMKASTEIIIMAADSVS